MEQWVAQWAGGLAIGVTCMAPSDKAPSTIGGVKEPTWYIMGKFSIIPSTFTTDKNFSFSCV